MHANIGARGRATLQSYESQAAVASHYSTGSTGEASKSEMAGRGAARPFVAPYTGGERFLQPFIPGQAILPVFEQREVASSFANNLQNVPSQQ